MPLFSAFTPFGHMRYSASPSRFETIYRSMRDGQGDAYGPNDVHQEARIYAGARCLAVSDGEIERAANEARPGKAQQTLAAHELDYGLRPTPTQTKADRRAALALQVRILRGCRKEALEDALSTLLGSDFIAATPMKDIAWPPTEWPASPATVGNFTRGALYRLFTVTESLAMVGARTVSLVDYVPGQEALKIGDVIVLEPAVLGMTEAVTVTAVPTAAATDADGYTTNTVTFTTTNPHGAGIVCTTAPMPILTATTRHIRIRVTAECAGNAIKRAAIHQLMRRILRGVTTWEVMTDAGEPGGNLLTLDDPVLGKLDVNVLS